MSGKLLNGNTPVNIYRALLLLAVSVIGYFLASLHSDVRDGLERIGNIEGKTIGIERDIEYLKEQVRDLQTRYRQTRPY